jgi:NH3-dependent NAD+ synthetase
MCGRVFTSIDRFVDVWYQIATTPPSSDQGEGRTEPPSPRTDGSFSNSEDEEAHSFDSIDTISERSTHHEGDIEAEKHHRMKKLLKYSQWIKKRTDGAPKEEEQSRSVLALERKMARQGEKLDKLCAQKP